MSYRLLCNQQKKVITLWNLHMRHPFVEDQVEEQKTESAGTNSFYSAFDSEISRRRSAGIPKQPNLSFSASKRLGRKAEA